MRTKPRIALFALVAVALALGSASLVIGGDEAPPVLEELGDFEASADDALRRPAEPAFATLDADAEGPADFEGEERDGEGERRELAPPSADAAPIGPALEVLVIDAATNEPVPGAEIFWAVVANPGERRRFGQLPHEARFGGIGRHLAVGLVAEGQRRRADDRGTTRLPPSPWRTLVAARSAGRVGFNEIEAGSGATELKVALVPDEPLNVLVVDPAGAPKAGAPVTVMQGSGNRDRGARVLWSGETDAAGLAQVQFFRLHMERIEERDPFSASFLAVLAVPLERPEFVAFRADPLPKEPLRLTMPATGHVELAVVDPDQRPLDSALRVWVQPRRGDGKQAPAILPKGFEGARWMDGVTATKERGAASVRLGPIGLGLELRAGMRFAERGRGERIEGPYFPGPRVADETIRATLVTPDWLAIARGRVLDPNGAPRAETRIPFQVRDAQRSWADSALTLDAEGRFELALRVDRPMAAPVTLEIVERREDGSALAALAVLPGFGPNVRSTIGDIRLAEVQPIARGRVVDERGQPVTRASVQVQVSFDGQRFVDGGLARSGVGEDGSFAVFGVPPQGTLRAAVTAPDHIAQVLPIVGIAAWLDVSLERAVDLRVLAEVQKGLPEQALSAELRAADGTKRSFQLRSRGETAGFVAEDLPRGNYDLAILLRNFAGDLYTMRGIAVHPDLPREQRTIRLDLRNVLHAYAIEVVGAGGVVDESARGVLVTHGASADGNLGWQAFQVQKGRASFVAPQPSLDAWFIPDGRGEVRALLRPGVTRMVTSAIHPVELGLPGVRAMLGDKTVRVSLVLLSDTGLPEGLSGIDQNSGGSFRLERAAMAKSGGGWLGADDRVRIPVTRNGRYQVVLRVSGRGGRSGRNTQESRAIGEIEVVVDGIQPTRVDLPLNSVEIQRLLDRLAKR
ncbi:MAG: carboxypeptidase regulatory-like domain-containing protein [Planctomycetes bacterium]|nr:carboxypeptidase regulatory-like domain-containing protein [Planctomycetota bacterium]